MDARILEGKQAIRDLIAASLATHGISVSWEPADVVVAPGESVGYTAGRNRLTFPDSNGNLLTTVGLTSTREGQASADRAPASCDQE